MTMTVQTVTLVTTAPQLLAESPLECVGVDTSVMVVPKFHTNGKLIQVIIVVIEGHCLIS